MNGFTLKTQATRIIPIVIITISLIFQQSSALGATLLDGAQSGHPKLYANMASFQKLKSDVASNSILQRWYRKLNTDAQSIMASSPVTYRVVGGRLLDQSREALRRISLLAGLYRIDGDPRKLERAKAELMAVCLFQDWNPSHFLDTAEMTEAVAIGYDWLYPELSAEEKVIISTAIITKGIQPALAIYDSQQGWWSRSNNNWNFVTNGGILAGSLVVSDIAPELSNMFLQKSLGSIQIPLRQFSPDGGWDESAMYWNYATRYMAFYIAGLQSVMNNDFGLLQTPGLKETGYFNYYLLSPDGLTFNYGDGHPEPDPAPQLFWLSSISGQPLFQRQEYERINKESLAGVDIFHMLWFNPATLQTSTPTLPKGRLFQRVNVGSYRTALRDPNAIFVGFKGGDNQASHAHLDLGNFVYDSLGQRWGIDIGSGNYNAQGYFGAQRFGYYNTSSPGHNILVINGNNQSSKAKSKVIDFVNQNNYFRATVDLTQAYATDTRLAQRTFEVTGNTFILKDYVEWLQPSSLVWNFHTIADVSVSGKTATLSANGKSVKMEIVLPADASFTLQENVGQVTIFKQPFTVKDITIPLENVSDKTTITVKITPAA